MVSVQAVFGFPPSSIADVPKGAMQFSPLVPQASALDAMSAGTLQSMVMLAPAGTIERRYAVACALLALEVGADFTVMALNKKGGSRLADELRHFGCDPVSDGRHHHRICACKRPAILTHIQEAIEAGALQHVAETGLWSQAGIFSWNRVDIGSAALAKALPRLSGRGADFGCGIGVLSLAALTSADISSLTLIDIDRRAVEAAKRNVQDARAHFVWGDACEAGLQGLDFVIMNPPFHDVGMEDQALGQQFVVAAAEALKIGGVCFLVANRHLPYEGTLKDAFKQVTLLSEAQGFKLYEARK